MTWVLKPAIVTRRNRRCVALHCIRLSSRCVSLNLKLHCALSWLETNKGAGKSADKDRSAVTRNGVQRGPTIEGMFQCAAVWRWAPLLHTNCARSAGTALRMAAFTPTRALIGLRALKFPARPSSAGDGGEIT